MLELLKSIRNDESFDIVWEKVISNAKALAVTDTPKTHYRLSYYEDFDIIINCTEGRFNQPGYCVYQGLETLLLKACREEELEEDYKMFAPFIRMILM